MPCVSVNKQKLLPFEQNVRAADKVVKLPNVDIDHLKCLVLLPAEIKIAPALLIKTREKLLQL